MTAEILRRAAGPLRGRVRVPGDKSISHRALLFAGLAEGTSQLEGLSAGEDVRASATAFRALGASITELSNGVVRVEGGRSRLHEPAGELDLGNSGTGMRLLAGVCASLGFETVLTGDASLRRRPMARVTRPLREMGASVEASGENETAPLRLHGGHLHGIDYAPPVASAQVKSAILLAGLVAEGETIVREVLATRRHTEEFLARCGAAVHTEESPGAYVVHLLASSLSPFDLVIPGDPSQAAFLCVAAAVVPGSDLVVENLYVGPGRAGFVEVLRAMGAELEIVPTGESIADVRVRHAPLRATEIAGALVPDLIDEIPVLCVAAAFAEGTTTIRDAAELRVKESDRIAAMHAVLSALGATVVEHEDGLEVTGGKALHGGAVAASLDHRIAMAAAIAALASDGEVEIEGFETVASSWPSFLADLEGLQ